jgi:hypothetical protein
LGKQLADHLLSVENELNDHTPAELFAALLASNTSSVLRR